jgi:hypothetical protein
VLGGGFVGDYLVQLSRSSDAGQSLLFTHTTNRGCGSVRFISIFLDRMEYTHCNEVGYDGGEGGSDRKEEPAISLPEFAEAGGLSEDIRDVGCAVGDVRYDRQQEKTQSGIKREDCLGRWISGYEVDGHDGREHQVISKPPTFPEFDGVGYVVLEA